MSLTTTRAGSLIWGSGEDPTRALGRTPASGQTLVHQYLDTASHATYWSQKTGTIAASGTKVTLADTTTATDLWNLAAAEITSAAGTKTTYGYDKDGNRTSMDPSSGPATTLAYDQANRLTSYAGVATYAYNGDGLRMSKTANGKTTGFAWDQSRSLPLVLTSGATNFIYGPGGQPIEQVNATTATYLHADQQGSTRLLTNFAGTVVGTYNYTPYGVPIGHTGTASTALQYNGDGWGSSACSGSILHANLNTLFTAASARWLDQQGLAGVAEQEWDYLAGIAVDKIGGAIFDRPQLVCP